MINIDNYIVEKILINKNTKIYKYILFSKKSNEDYKNVVKESLEEICTHIQNNTGKLGTFFVYKCPNDLVKEFIDNWNNFNPIPGEGIDVKKWALENNIIELKAQDINDCISRMNK